MEKEFRVNIYDILTLVPVIFIAKHITTLCLVGKTFRKITNLLAFEHAASRLKCNINL